MDDKTKNKSHAYHEQNVYSTGRNSNHRFRLSGKSGLDQIKSRKEVWHGGDDAGEDWPEG